ncbi:acyltransferase family protein [Massilia sp. PWRC2]|uniref:acyltransferase family protein n=1 Tax=Massilia sp. PWRC2 TaxID=2804626 RepID=UPI003CFA08F9
MSTNLTATKIPDPYSSAQQDSWGSALIALVRALAAIEVAAAHLRAIFYPGMRTIADPSLWYQGFAFITGFGHQAVLLFFVISGWLVGGSLLDKWQQSGAIANYAVDRLTRLWTGLIPVFILSLLLSLSRGELDTSTIDYTSRGEFSALTFAGNLIGLQLISVPAYGGNFALWSLSNESWYYLLFPLLVLMFRADRRSVRVMAALTICALAIALPPVLLLYFIIWLLGAAASRVQIDCSSPMRAIVIFIAIIASCFCRLKGLNDDISMAAFVPDLVLGLLFLLVLCSLQNSAAPTFPSFVLLAKLGRFFAEFSFTLYLIHVPLIYVLKIVCHKTLGVGQFSPHDPLHIGVYILMLCFLVVCAYLFYLLFEARTPQIRTWVKRKLLRPVQRQPMPV